jgi:pimeloyl-ACP methyl ester carboxylesterase
LTFTIPTPLSTVDIAMEDGAVIRLRRHGNPDGPRLALSHGNGLAIDGYLPFWELLRERYDLILFDFRNHGQNPLHRFEHHHWPRFILDLERVFAAIADHFGAKPIAGVFHSLSAVTATMQTQRYGPRWSPLVLFDPPFYPPERLHARMAEFSDAQAIAERAAKRKNAFADPQELAASFARRMKKWPPQAYELMARATLRYDPASREWVLACPREFEAHVFGSNRDPATWEGLGAMPVPVKLIGGDPDDEEATPPSRIAREAAREFNLEYETIPHTSHFLQIERPRECVAAMESYLRDQGFIS